MVIPPPSIGPTGQYQVVAPPPERRRDPFATAPSATPTGRAPLIVDRGPPVAIPEPTQSPWPWLGGALAVLLLGLVAGHASGSIFHARKLYNRTIVDAQRLNQEVEKLAQLDQQVGSAVRQSLQRNPQRRAFDSALVTALKDLQASSPYANSEGMRRVENTLFRTNYAMMDDLLISRLFNYYNNTLRLVRAVEDFVDHAESQQRAIETYLKESAESVQRKNGIVLVDDKGSFFLGSLVEVGDPYCSSEQATTDKKCKLSEIQGFFVRSGGAKTWSRRPGKPAKGGLLSNLVVPIVPDAEWQAVAGAKPGFLAHELYVSRLSALLSLSALVEKDRKPLLESLAQQATRPTLFAL
ncbi:MAG: hypothetical protein IPL40_16445 [Proteobacteria bacterium]|nr:hypothetical protein [Pseudomonadota bacterium]